MADVDLAGMQKELTFVASSVRRRQQSAISLATNLTWGLVIFVGFSLNDFYPPAVVGFWSISLPLAVLTSVLLHWRAGRRIGEDDFRFRRKIALHWGGIVCAIGLMFLLTSCHVLSAEALRLPVLVLLSLGYFLAGVHLDRSYLWAGLIMAAGAIASIFVWQYLPTILGAAVCVALVAGAVLRLSKR